eukprot:1670532-Pleurochrysis_carterae.AAC.3
MGIAGIARNFHSVRTESGARLPVGVAADVDVRPSRNLRKATARLHTQARRQHRWASARGRADLALAQCVQHSVRDLLPVST